jgi:DNA-directed RNA polymerase subunit H
MADNFVLIDNIYRSRLTLLDILEGRGYDVNPYKKFSPVEITAATAVSGNENWKALNFTVSKKDDETKKCEVRYVQVTRPGLPKLLENVTDEEAESTEFIIMIPNGAVSDIHHQYSLNQYNKMKENKEERRKLRVYFFSVSALVINPLKHVLVPEHKIVAPEKHKELMDSLYITSKSKFPEIKFHADPITRCIGAVPGDIIEIKRFSASSGEAIIYRLCS